MIVAELKASALSRRLTAFAERAAHAAADKVRQGLRDNPSDGFGRSPPGGARNGQRYWRDPRALWPDFTKD
jgi:hypothetical protein